MIIDRTALETHVAGEFCMPPERVLRLYQVYLEAFALVARPDAPHPTVAESTVMDALAHAWAVEDLQLEPFQGIDNLDDFASRIEEHLAPSGGGAFTAFEFTPHEVDRLAEALEAMHGVRDPLRLKVLEHRKDE